MYAGRIVETAPSEELFSSMRHPYTQALLGSIPRLEPDATKPLLSIPGLPPDLTNPPPGCRFAARCPFATEQCMRRGAAARPATATTSSPAGTRSTARRVTKPLLAMTPAEVAGTIAGESIDDSSDRRPSRGAASAVSVVAEPDPAAGRHRLQRQRAPLLEVINVVREYPVTAGPILRRKVNSVKAVSDVDLHVNPGEALGLVGESGCGKTSLGKLIVGIEKPDSGQVKLDGSEIFKLRGGDLRRARRDVQMMFQDPYGSLDPRMRVRAILREPLQIQGIGTTREQDERVRSLLDEVGLPHNALERYPHEFSGGQRQRIALARALMLEPKVMVADEPVSALDVSIRSQVLNLMKRLQAEHQMASVVISHDLAVVKYLADRIGVMYLGKIVELGTGDDIYRRAAHPYTEALIKTIPVPDPAIEKAKTDVGIRGELPSPIDPPSGCRFRTRCPLAQEICARGRAAAAALRRRAIRPPATSRCRRPSRTGRRPPTPAPRRPPRQPDSGAGRCAERLDRREQLGAVVDDEVGGGEVRAAVRAGRDGDAAHVVGVRAGDVTRRVADHDGARRAATRCSSPAASPARRRAIGGSIVRSSESEPKPPWSWANQWPMPARLELHPRDRLEVAGDQREPHVVVARATIRAVRAFLVLPSPRGQPGRGPRTGGSIPPERLPRVRRFFRLRLPPRAGTGGRSHRQFCPLPTRPI